MDLGYARISTNKQEELSQVDKLKAAGCERIWTETASGARTDRPQLEDLMRNARPGDRITVWRLDRLGRSVAHLVALVNEMNERGIEFRSLHEGFDTRTSVGKLIFHIFAAFAEFERNLIMERAELRRQSASARADKGGRPFMLSPGAQARLIAMFQGGMSKSKISAALGVSRMTVRRVIEAYQAELEAGGLDETETVMKRHAEAVAMEKLSNAIKEETDRAMVQQVDAGELVTVSTEELAALREAAGHAA